MIKLVQIKSIIIDAGTQIRTSLDKGHVEDLSEAYGRGDSVPPVEVFQTFAGGLILADGYHRVEAARARGDKEISANVQKGEKPDALRFALSANVAHGLRRTNEDKRRSVKLALDQWPDLSSLLIAEMCGVGDGLVETIRKKPSRLEPQSSPPEKGSEGSKPSSGPPPKRIGRDGVARSLPSRTPPPPKAKLDKLGRAIPLPILPLWDRAEDASTALACLSAVRGILQKAQDESDLAFAEVSFSSIKGHLDQAYADLKVVKPYAVCPTCQGLNVSKCAVCKGRGFISQFYYNSCVPKETREMLEKGSSK